MRVSRAAAGSLLAWGRAAEHATGSPTAAAGRVDHHGALRPSGPSGARADFVSAAAGHLASGALAADGAAFVWGTGRALGLGRGVASAAAPRALGGVPPLRLLALGEHTGAAVCARDAQARVWGVGVDGQLGLGGALGPLGSYHGGEQEALVAAPRALAGEPLAAVALARFRTLLLTADGVVFAAGAGFHGELGISGTSGVATAPASVVGLPAGVTAIAAAHTFSLAATRCGRLFVWGLVGRGGTRAVVGARGGAAAAPPRAAAAAPTLRAAAPLELALPGGVGAPLMLAAGHGHAIISDGARLWMLGAAWAGDGAVAVAPARVALPAGVARVARVAAGPWTAGIVDERGRVWLAGRLVSPLLLGSGERPSADQDGLVNVDGALFAPRLTRVVDGALEGARVVDLALGAAHAVAVVE